MDIIEANLQAMIDNYENDLIEACITFDIEKLKAHFDKYQKRGYFPACFTLPADSVLEITMRKIVFNSDRAPADKQAEAATWLISNGYDLYLD